MIAGSTYYPHPTPGAVDHDDDGDTPPTTLIDFLLKSYDDKWTVASCTYNFGSALQDGELQAGGPNVDLELPPIGWDELYSKYWIAGEAGVFPDIIWAAPDMMVRSMNNDIWLPFPDEAIPSAWIEDNFVAPSLEQLKVDGSYYLVCWEMAMMGLQANKNILSEIGYDSLPGSFNEFVDMAKAAVVKDGDNVTRSGFSIHGIKDIYRDILQSMGGEHLTDIWEDEVPFNNETTPSTFFYK